MSKLFILATIALITFPTSTRSQENRISLKTQPTRTVNTGPTRLALEVVYYIGAAPAYLAVPSPEAKRAGAWFGRFSRGPNWKLPEGSLPVTAVRVESQFNGETVEIHVSVLRGRFHDQEDFVAVYHLGENEKIIVGELKTFGVEPFEIKVIRVSPSVVNPNNIINKTQSLEVITVQAVDSTLPQYQLTLRNLSNKAISAIWLGVERNGKVVLSSIPHDPAEGRPLIAAGDVYQTRPLGVTRGLEMGQGYVPEPLDSQNVVIGALVFDDGTWEGTPSYAATFRAFVAGRRLQIASVIGNLDGILSTAELTAPPAIADLRTRVSRSDADLDNAAYVQVLSEFPTLTKTQQEDLRRGVEVATHGIRKTLLDNLNAFEKQHPQNRPEDFRAWVLNEKRKYEVWLQRLGTPESSLR
jgi:hypothetical protein